MNWDAIGAIGQILGTIVVIATLGYLAIQIRQNSEMLHFASRQALIENDRHGIFAHLEHIDLLEKLANAEELSPRDQYRYSALWIIEMRNKELEFFQYKAGVLDEAAWYSYKQTLHYAFGTERDRQWWSIVGRVSFDPDFVAMVDEFIRDAPTNNLLYDAFNWEKQSPNSSGE